MPTYLGQSDGSKFFALLQQDDQIGRIFAYRAIVYFWYPKYCATFFRLKSLLNYF
jgi:hypothetical protein